LQKKRRKKTFFNFGPRRCNRRAQSNKSFWGAFFQKGAFLQHRALVMTLDPSNVMPGEGRASPTCLSGNAEQRVSQFMGWD
jgi:hypothetical protein